MEQAVDTRPEQVAAPRARQVMGGAVLLAAAAGLVPLWMARTLDFHYVGPELVVAAGLAVWVALELAWGLVVTVRGLAPGDHRAGGLPGRRRLLAWFLLVVVLVAVKAPVYANLALSWSALTEQVRAVQAGRDLDAPARVGGFDVLEAFRTDPACTGAGCEVVLAVDDGTSALVWSANGAPGFRLADSNGHLVGPWYWSVDE